jgi:SPP1 gp7 family putative phage head morphogenesis protein
MSTKTPIEAGMIAMAANWAKQTVMGWFGPLAPRQPMVPVDQQESVVGRQFDYPTGININVTPRSTDAVSFAQLRGLADACDVLRIVIETRKDQIAKLNWTIKPIDDKADHDKRCDEILNMLRLPDKEHDWDTWLRMLLEDLFVIDAPTVYVRKTVGGKLWALEPVDGATIKRVITEQGRTPDGDQPAYQQILKGVVASDYRREELIYRPRNVRTNKIYGYSPVEQILMTVNTAIRRSLSQLQYYTEGNIPEALIGVPNEWSVDQIKAFQDYWDSILEGNSAQKRHAKFVPGEMKFQGTKDAMLKDMFDEWLARVVCFAFSIEPTPFVQHVNRATAETAREAALAEGLAPIMQWVKNLMNYIIWNVYGYADLEFAWTDEKEQDPYKKAQVAEIYLQNDVILVEEVRADLGLDPFTAEQLAAIAEKKAAAAAMFTPGGGAYGDEEDDEPGTKTSKVPPLPKKPDDKAEGKEAGVSKAKKSSKAKPIPIAQDRKATKKLQAQLAKTLTKFLADQVKPIAAQLHAVINKADGDSKSKAKKAVDELKIDWDSLVPDVSVVIGAVAEDGSKTALKMLDVSADTGPTTTEWAQNRAAELIGKKWEDGVLVDNPDAQWVITDSTRDMIQAFTADAIDSGMTTDELADALEESFAFSPARAEMIARTETALADSAGQMEGYIASGVVEGTEWTTAEDDRVSDDCMMNGEAGVIPLGEVYPSGDLAPPAHPNCRCAIVAVLMPEGA